MRIALVDDEQKQRQKLLSCIDDWHRSNGVTVVCEEFDSGEGFLKQAESQQYDLAFLDIYMGDRDGIETAHLLRRLDDGCQVVFLTASRAHMLQAFSVHAYQYLLKPMQTQRVTQVLDELRQSQSKKGPVLTFLVEHTEVNVPFDAVRCVTSSSHYCYVYAQQVARCRTTFRELTAPLVKDPRFLEINRGVLVNMDYIATMEDGVCRLLDGTQLPLNLRKSTALRRQLTSYRFSVREGSLRREEEL